MPTSPGHVKILEDWMKSYRPEELFDESGRSGPSWPSSAPRGTRRMGANPARQWRRCSCAISGFPTSATTRCRCASPGAATAEATRVMGKFLRDVMKLNLDGRNFRLFSPDENNSNRWQDVLEVTNRSLDRRDLSVTTITSRPTGA